MSDLGLAARWTRRNAEIRMRLKRLARRVGRIWLLLLVGVVALSASLIGIAFAAAPEQPPDFSGGRGIVAVLLVGLMAALFTYLFMWQHRIEQADYFGNIYREAVENIEFDRHAITIKSRWAQGAYAEELLNEGTPRATAWRDDIRNKRPSLKAELQSSARAVDELSGWGGLRCQSRVNYLETSMIRSLMRVGLPEGAGTNPFEGSGSGIGNLGQSAGTQWAADESGSGGFGEDTQYQDPGAQQKIEERQKQVADRQKDFDQRFSEYLGDWQKWVELAKACMYHWYTQDLAEVRREAKKSAELALAVDFSVLRGRGPEFILEFTALIVIIFAAVILGIGSVLGKEQIGTLLAAIAGYVLGKAVSRGQSAERTSNGSSGGLKMRDPGRRSDN